MSELSDDSSFSGANQQKEKAIIVESESEESELNKTSPLKQ